MNERKKRIVQGVLVVLLGVGILSYNQNKKAEKEEEKAPSYSQFIKDIKENKIKEVVITEKVRGSEVKVVTTTDEKYKILTPADKDFIKDLRDSNTTVKIERESNNILLSIIVSWFPMFLLIAVWIFFMRKSMGGKGGILGLTKNKGKMISPDNIDINFSDIVGIEEVKQEVQEIVEFLKNPEKYSKLGGKIPGGVLLTGSAGVGKTLLGKAMAKEAGVPFFAMSGSDFVEMFVGLGASRVRDMFADAKKVAPCIIFIDEIDAIGGKRSSGAFGGGGQDEREQTLNQLLVEMDGIEGKNGVVLIGATNRPDVLDPALLRPGRLDRHVAIPLPDVKGREQILALHINRKNVPVAIDLDIGHIAKGASGFSGAELANLVNEAAITAARKDKSFVEQEDFEIARDKIIMGPERRSLSMPEHERVNTAYHESGHAVVAKLLVGADPVHKVTIIPRGRALGVTMQVPDEDKYAHDKEYLLGRIAVLMGGRIGEEVFLNHMTTGASNDIAVATNLASKMVKEWGMSSLGMISFGDSVGGSWAGQSTMSNLSQETIREVDLEIRKIIQEQYHVARQLIESNKDKVEKMAKTLLEIETLEDWQIENIMQGRPYGLRQSSAVEEDKVGITIAPESEGNTGHDVG